MIRELLALVDQQQTYRPPYEPVQTPMVGQFVDLQRATGRKGPKVRVRVVADAFSERGFEETVTDQNKVKTRRKRPSEIERSTSSARVLDVLKRQKS